MVSRLRRHVSEFLILIRIHQKAVAGRTVDPLHSTNSLMSPHHSANRDHLAHSLGYPIRTETYHSSTGFPPTRYHPLGYSNQLCLKPMTLGHPTCRTKYLTRRTWNYSGQPSRSATGQPHSHRSQDKYWRTRGWFWCWVGPSEMNLVVSPGSVRLGGESIRNAWRLGIVCCWRHTWVAWLAFGLWFSNSFLFHCPFYRASIGLSWTTFRNLTKQ